LLLFIAMKRLILIFSIFTINASPIFPQSSNWLKTARVFLIDAYQPPFVPELEYNAEELAETMVDMHANVLRFGTMGKFATIQGVRFSTHPDQGDRDLLQESIDACKPRNIKVIPYISTGHKLAWSMVTRDYPEYAHRASPGGLPEKLQMMIGEDHGTVCWMTSYRQAFYDLVEHVVRDYDVYGMYFDAWRPFYFWGGKQTCYCEGCLTGFRKATGYEIPYHENNNDYTEKELEIIDRYHQWYVEEFIGIVQQTRKLIKSYKDVPLISNIGNPENMAREDPRILEAMDAFLYERGESLLERAEGTSLAVAAGLDVWPYVGVYNNWQRVAYNGYDFHQQILTNMMFGGGSIIAQPYPYVSHQENRHYVGDAFRIIESAEEDLAASWNDPYTAVVYSSKNPPGHIKNNWWANADSRNASLGAFAAFLYHHIQVSSIHEFMLDRPEELNKYRILYLADMTYLDKDRIDNLKTYVRNGGGLMVGYGTSLYDAQGGRMDHFGLEELIRVRPLRPVGELKDQVYKYSTKIGGPSDLYLMKEDKVASGLGSYWDDRLVPLWFYEPVEVMEGGEVLMNIVTGDERRTLLPGVVISSYGNGKVIYSASSIESLFLQDGISVLGDLIFELSQLVTDQDPPYWITGPASLQTNLMKSEKSWILHLTNWIGNKFERKQMNEYYLAPVENVGVVIRIPEEKKIRSVETYMEMPFEKRITDGSLELLFPRIETYQGIKITFE